MTLYEIDNKLREMLDGLMDHVDTDGVVDPEYTSELEALNVEREQKLENVALYIKECDAEAKAIDEEVNKLKERSAKAKKKAESLRDYLTHSLIDNGQDNGFSTARCKVTFLPKEAVDIPDESFLDPKYFVTKTNTVPDKRAIKAALDRGESVCGATLKMNYNIQIK